MKDRTVACVNYDHEGSCRKGRDGTFWHKCQTCSLYNPIHGGEPVRGDWRNKKRADAIRKDMRYE